MRIKIDKDFNERKVLQESFDAKRKAYRVLAMNGKSDKFTYGRSLTISEARNAILDLAKDEKFKDCDKCQIVESYGLKMNKMRVIWEGSAKEETAKKVVDESAKKVVEQPKTEASRPKIVAQESKTWTFNGKSMTRQEFERAAIKTFYSYLMDESVDSIKFNSGSKSIVYETKNGSTSYSEFRNFIRETTKKMEKEPKVVGYSITTKNEGGCKTKLTEGFKPSDFDRDGSWIDRTDEADKSKMVFTESISFKKPPKKIEVVKESSSEPKKTEQKKKESVNESLTLEMDVVDPEGQIKQLMQSMGKYSSPTTVPPTKTVEVPMKPVSKSEVNPIPEVKEMVDEADGEEEEAPADDGGGDAAPDAGGDAGGGDADPFADDGGGGEGGGDPFADDGGEGGGAEADPFADDAGGGDAAADATGGGAEGGAEGGADDATAEPAPDSAVNTDAQGNQKSQYNINVTRPFNVDDNFSLNEEEQKEFFGKIDQLVKIPDMENYSLYLYQITPENMNLDDVHYIQSLYDLSVKLGLLEDVFADSNLLEKYSSYKYSVVKDGDTEGGEDGGELTIQESGRIVLEDTGNPKSQQDNEEKKEQTRKMGKAKVDSDDRRGPKETKLKKDKNGADIPVVIDTTTKEFNTDFSGKKAFDSTEAGEFRGLGWIATFKAMQFGSPRYMSMYIKKNGKGKAEEQCKKYLEKLSYTEIEFVDIEEVDPYEYVYRNSAAGMKTPEEIRAAKNMNEPKGIPYLESADSTSPTSLPKDVQRDIKRILTKLNSEIRGTKQFSFIKECGVEKPQVALKEFLECYTSAQVDENVGDTIYKFVLKKNDSIMSRMFYSNMKEKLFRYLGIFATKFNLECACESTPSTIKIDFTRSTIGNPMGYDLDTIIDANEVNQEGESI